MQTFKAPPTSHSLLGLAAGLILGTVCQGSEHVVIGVFTSIVDLVGMLWTSVLIAIALPLVSANLLSTLVNRASPEGLGTVALFAFPLFIALLCVGCLFSAFLAPLLLAWIDVDPASLSGLSISIPTAAREAASGAGESPTFGVWLVNLLPTNPVQPFVDGDVLQVLVVFILLGIAANRLPKESKKPIADLANAASTTLFVLLSWVLRFTAAGVFALAYSTATGMGVEAAGLLVQWILIVCVVLLLHTVLLNVLTVVLGGVSLPSFARAVAPAQLVGLTTRSSLAALPVLIDSARKRLSLRPGVGEFVLPLAAASFKSHRTVSSTTEMIFLAHVYGVDLTFEKILGFVITVIVLSFSAVGVPGGGRRFTELPAYLALGIPIEGYLVLEAVEVIPDIFKTVNNVTGYMSATVLLNRLV